MEGGGCSALNHLEFYEAQYPLGDAHELKLILNSDTDLQGIYDLQEGALSLTSLS